ncbi:neuropeptide CCHamide-2 receptor isoform X1 [Daphnia magna]|uniref:neuropeptide CCHamide-2 receptor isoform X1 n=1 Tax=Daphnia magna TaxID=35525 RepID=UPI001E1BC462|nr:neuropeptide CCHamide-2 receptor isoform X1 [Daphnia magna]XP_045034975.1 neuropeptide CCHamide-2 receptor isoform X1 [Daphnia magna]XP_045034976.1 neuropeptide CCHamide-2 receptor isoform X1 [Daphnia magna]XP_045034977.1 neuropeptide CCHamide-2 receptor isoform X1 [Daphnia magna]XP_045034978.1 neuropeptide CCHamide-2 receptor isoform X1 [Daphnia magna]XP_045034979.1 neuropeptide CCHamide-2 receptor isoform X1 [Daphnia magna]
MTMMPNEVANESHWSAMDEDEELSDGYVAYSERLETYIVPVVFGIIFLVGVIGNGSLIYVLCRHKSMRSVPNTFIFNLAVGDLLILICTVPFTSTIYTFDSWPYGEFVCKASEFAKVIAAVLDVSNDRQVAFDTEDLVTVYFILFIYFLGLFKMNGKPRVLGRQSINSKDTSVGVSVFTLTALSFDRYTAIVRPVQSFVSGPRSKLVIVCLAVIWLTSLVLALPAVFFSHLLKHSGERIPDSERDVDANGTMIGPTHREIHICYPFPQEFGPDYPRIVILLRFLLHYFLPLITIGTFYAIMAHHLLRSVQNIPGQAMLTATSVRHRYQTEPSSSNQSEPTVLLQQHQQPNQNRARRKLAKMVLSFVVLFAVCFLPIHVYFMWFYFNPNSEAEYNAFWHALKIFGFVLAYTNSCINPIALYCVSTSFRKHFNRLLCCCGADQGANGHHSGPVSYCGGSLCAGNAASYSRAGGTALLTEDPAAFTHHSSGRRQNTMLTSISRRHPQAENQKNVDGDYPLNELHRQLHQPTAVRTQSSC